MQQHGERSVKQTAADQIQAGLNESIPITPSTGVKGQNNSILSFLEV